MLNHAIQEIHNSLVNGQKEQMVEQIDKYGATFWEDYRYNLTEYCWSDRRNYFQDATIIYFKIKNR